MCGKETQLFKAEIEGAVLKVCRSCSRFGKILSRIKSEEEIKQQKKLQKQHEVREAAKEQKPEEIEMVAGDFSKIIRQKREQLGLNQEDFAKKINEKQSLLHKMETGSFKPSLDKAKKLEKILRVTLTETMTLKHEAVEAEKSESLTIGDLIKIKKR